LVLWQRFVEEWNNTGRGSATLMPENAQARRADRRVAGDEGGGCGGKGRGGRNNGEGAIHWARGRTKQLRMGLLFCTKLNIYAAGG
jgi:hypothetical protein